jgi:hypothetical protein
MRQAFAQVPPMLQQANQWMAAGNYSQAAEAFGQLARGAEDRFPERAPFLYLQAGQAAVLGGETKAGVAHLRRGLTILAAQGRYRKMRIFGRRIVDELNERGLTREANEIAQLLKGNLPAQPEAVTTPARRPTLPTHCPSCGAAMRIDEVEWMDDVTAECAYCGSPVRGDG